MHVVIKNIKRESIKTIYLNDLDSFQKTYDDLNDLKEPSEENKPFEVNLIAIDEIINSSQLSKFKLFIERLNVNFLQIFSNNRETILTGKFLKIDSKFVSKNDLRNRLFLHKSKKPDDILHKGTVRSGHRIFSNGDLFIIGDVNPGAIVSAKNNVFVWGKLLGIALAGEGGNTNASIASLYLNPLQLRISDVVAIGPKDKPRNSYPEIAVLDKKSIIIKPYLINNQT